MKFFRVFYFIFSAFILFSCSSKPEDKKIVIDSVPVKIEKPVVNHDSILEDLLDIKSVAELKARFGEENISVNKIWGEEGAYALGSYIDFGGKDELAVRWKDYPNCTAVSEVIVRSRISSAGIEGYNTRWKSKTGIKIGMSTDELEKINGKPFVMDGFDESVITGISDWKGGAINGNEVEILISGSGKMNSLSPKEMSGLLKMVNIPSSNEVIQKVQPRVIRICVHKAE
jgi:hypothetical protein